jgi:hypothetical protein
VKININVNSKIGQPNFGSFGAGCSIELDIDQAALKQPDDVLAQIRFAGDLARAAVERELDLQRKHGQSQAPAREPGDDDQPDDDLRPGDPAYDRARPDRGRRESDTQDRRDNRDDRRQAYRESYQDDDRGRSEDRRDDDRRPARRDDRPRSGGRDDELPRNGKALWAFAKDNGAVEYFNRLGKKRGWPFKFTDWHPDDVQDAVHEYFAKGPGPTSMNGASSSNARRN